MTLRDDPTRPAGDFNSPRYRRGEIPRVVSGSKDRQAHVITRQRIDIICGENGDPNINSLAREAKAKMILPIQIGGKALNLCPSGALIKNLQIVDD